MPLENTLKHIQVHTSKTEMQRGSMNVNFALDFALLAKLATKAVSKVVDGLRGDASVAAQEVGFDSLRETVDGRPRGIDTLIRPMRGMHFSL